MSGTKAKEMEDLSLIKQELAKVFDKKLDLVDLLGEAEDESDLDEILTLVQECIADLMTFADGIVEYRNQKRLEKGKKAKKDKKGQGAKQDGSSDGNPQNQATTSAQ